MSVNLSRILIVRLGAMGDIIHTLPALATLRRAFPLATITWVVDAKWRLLLDGNPCVDRVISGGDWKVLRAGEYDLTIDFQGLLKSAIVARVARSRRVAGFQKPRESPAGWFYGEKASTTAVHMVEQNIDLAIAVGATERVRLFPLPPGAPDGSLPSGGFVLASPLAGWGAKQWPLKNYSVVGEKLSREHGLTLVLNGPQRIAAEHTVAHVSGLPGLIDASRRATAIIGLDSGPLHLAAALGKSGVAIYGPTDPARNGPYGGAFTVLRDPSAITSHRRASEPDASMRAISPEAVYYALEAVLQPALKRSQA
ncbi:MAG: glycosyltransferase family 9 protein [Acidobacteriota bacterium]|nr:glycosyltransferase family 9 protein [Acidobacteriota bacterium]